MKLETKIKKLREYARDTDNENFESTLQEWENEITKADLITEYRQFDLSKNINHALVSICLHINRKLINEDDQKERIRLKADLERTTWLLKFYSNNPDEQLQDIEKEIDEAIERLEIK